MAEQQAAYRISLSSEFDLTAAASQADYFSALGVSHVRCTPSPRLSLCATEGRVGDLTHANRDGFRSQEHLTFTAALGRYSLEQLPENSARHDTQGTSALDRPGLAESPGGHEIVGNGLLSVAAGLFSWQEPGLSKIRQSFTGESRGCSPENAARTQRGPITGKGEAETDQFHELCARIQSESTEALIALPVDELGRGEDALARVLVLSEIPEVWRTAIAGWSARLNGYRKNDFPDRALEYLFYETAVGSWPVDELRLVSFLTKAARQSGMYTSWMQPTEEFERALREFIGQALLDEGFMTELRELVAAIIMAGRLNSMALTLIKLTAPGVPQIHQGTELWDLSLADVDDDQRVDYARRRKLLREIATCDARACLMRMAEGMPKLWILHRTLLLRKFRPEPFCANSRYTPVHASGSFSRHLVGYLRANDIMVVVPRWTIRRGLDWRDTTIEVPSGDWVNCLTDENVSGGVRSITELTSNFPLVLLERIH